MSRPCPGCGRAPDPRALRLTVLSGEIAALGLRVEDARQAYAGVLAAWQAKQAERHALAFSVMASVAAERGAAPAPAVSAGSASPLGPAGPASPAASPAVLPTALPTQPVTAMRWPGADRLGTSDASPRTVQNLLFVLGGALLGIGAIVFTAVAWARYGVLGRELILAVATLVGFAIPIVAQRRTLRATAETFAATALLLLTLDGYGAWRLDLLGISAHLTGTTYTGLLAVLISVIAAGYGTAVRLTGPRIVALLAAQPVLPLLLAAHRPSDAGWAAATALITAANVVVAKRLRPGQLFAAVPAPLSAGVPGPLFAGVPGPLSAAVPGPLFAGVPVPTPPARVTATRQAVSPSAVTSEPAATASAIPALATPPVPAMAPVTDVVAAPPARDQLTGLLGTLAWFTGASWLGIATLLGLAGMIDTYDVSIIPAAAALCLVAAVTLLLAERIAEPLLRAATVAAATLDVGFVMVNVGVLRWHGHPIIVVAPMAIALAVATRMIRPTVWVALGIRAATRAVTGILAAGTLVPLAAGVAVRLLRIAPVWHTHLGSLTAPAVPVHGQSIGVVALFVATALLVGRTRWGWLAVATTVPLLFSLENARGLDWWAAPAMDAASVLCLLAVTVLALRRGRAVIARVAAGAAALLTLHALMVALVRPGATAAALGGVVLVGTATLLCCRFAVADGVLRWRIGGIALAAALVALPGAVAAGIATGSPDSVWLPRVSMAAVAVGLATLVAVRRWIEIRWYGLIPVLVTATLVGLAQVAIDPSESRTIYVLVGLLIVVLAPIMSGLRGAAAFAPMAAGGVLAVAAVIRVVQIGATVLVLPYGWLAHIWAGAPTGVGLSPHGWRLSSLDVIAMLLVAGVAAVVGFTVGGSAVGGSTGGGFAAGGRRAAARAALLPVTITVLVWLVVGGAAWPAVPIVSFLVAATMVWRAALGRRGPAALVAAWTGLVTLGAGSAGLTPTKAGTLCALGGLVVVGAVIGAAGREVATRVAGWLGAAGAAELLAFTAMRAAHAGLGQTSFGVLAVAAVVLLASAAIPAAHGAAMSMPRGAAMAAAHGAAGSASREPLRRAAEAVALTAAAHAGAFVALMLAGSLDRAAIVSAGWGIMVGARALWPGVGHVTRRTLVCVAAGLELLAWWLLAAAQGVHVVDAYTLPLAGVALLAGVLAARSQPELRSWIAYGPALVAAFGPSLEPVLHSDASVTRRAVLGVAALVVVLIGAEARLQAPVVVAGGVLVVLALHEIVLAWRLLPTWLPLTVAGLAIIGVATTYERRRRDFNRLRGAVGRMA